MPESAVSPSPRINNTATAAHEDGSCHGTIGTGIHQHRHRGPSEWFFHGGADWGGWCGTVRDVKGTAVLVPAADATPDAAVWWPVGLTWSQICSLPGRRISTRSPLNVNGETDKRADICRSLSLTHTHTHTHTLTHTHSYLQFLYEHFFLCACDAVSGEGSSKKRVPAQVGWVLPRVSSSSSRFSSSSSRFSPPLPPLCHPTSCLFSTNSLPGRGRGAALLLRVRAPRSGRNRAHSEMEGRGWEPDPGGDAGRAGEGWAGLGWAGEGRLPPLCGSK